jgi:hypothetical protein
MVEYQPGKNCTPGEDGEDNIYFGLPGKIFHYNFLLPNRLKLFLYGFGEEFSC